MTTAAWHRSLKGARSTVLAVLALASGSAPGGVLGADSLEFQLPTLSGSAFVKVADFPNRVVLINVWGTECPPCVRETPLLDAQAQLYGNVQFLGIATDDRIASLRFTARFHVRYPQLQAPSNPSGLLRRLGDPHGALPFTVVLDRRHRICAQRLGEVDARWIATAVHECTVEGLTDSSG